MERVSEEKVKAAEITVKGIILYLYCTLDQIDGATDRRGGTGVGVVSALESATFPAAASGLGPTGFWATIGLGAVDNAGLDSGFAAGRGTAARSGGFTAVSAGAVTGAASSVPFWAPSTLGRLARGGATGIDRAGSGCVAAGRSSLFTGLSAATPAGAEALASVDSVLCLTVRRGNAR